MAISPAQNEKDDRAKTDELDQSPSTIIDAATPLPPYSAFTKLQKWLIIFLSTFAASFSPLSSFIFFPAIPALADALHVSTGKINLTVTSYLIVAGVAPALLGDLADTVGRRAVYILMMAIYCVANVGLAVQNSWGALFALRMLQSAGSASTIAVGYGVVSDIATPAERGHFVTGMVLGPNIATAVGPVLGGTLAQYASWRWIFWLLTILSAACLLFILALFPETARAVVGDGTRVISPVRQPPLIWLIPTHSTSGDEEGGASRKCRIPNPIGSLKLLTAVDCLIIVLIFGIFYMNLSCVQASTSTLFIEIYGISQFDAGLIYLPAGIGSIIGAYGAGYILTHSYRITAKKHDLPINAPHGDDLTYFPIEEARLLYIPYTVSAAGICTVGYGWALQYHTHISVPLILQFMIGFATAIVFNTTGTLLTDIHPTSPSTASAANSIVRCLLAGGGLAIVQILIDAIGVQWTFTLLGGICLLCLGLVAVEWRWGERWREAARRKGMKR